MTYFAFSAIMAGDDTTSTTSTTSAAESIEEWNRCLKHNFGHSSFKDYQIPIIDGIIRQKKNLLVIMSTGRGKSLSYQFPPVYLEKTAIVISPLKSLISDQTLNLRSKGIEAEMVMSSHPLTAAITKKIVDGVVRVIYTTPETIKTRPELVEAAREHLCMVAIDEAHCISQWGCEFRPSYREIIPSLGKIDFPIVALTATAPKRVADDIVFWLGGGMTLYRVPSQKSNFSIFIKPKKSNFQEDLSPFFSKFADNACLIFTPTKREAEEISSWLRENGIKSDYYHAGREEKDRSRVQTDFIFDRLRVVACTLAFAMGIDKPNIKLVINYGIPSDLTHYYQ